MQFIRRRNFSYWRRVNSSGDSRRWRRLHAGHIRTRRPVGQRRRSRDGSLRGQINRRAIRDLLRWRTAALQRHRHIYLVQMPAAEHQLIGRLTWYVRSPRSSLPAPTLYFRAWRARRCFPIVGTEGIVKFSRTHSIEFGKSGVMRRSALLIQVEVRFHRSRIHADHQVVPILRRRERHGGSWAYP